MPHALFHVTEINPNDTTGGGGCICSPTRETDCRAPYVVFPGNDMENISSPHVVIGYRCLELAHKAVTTGEILGAGERSEVDRVKLEQQWNDDSGDEDVPDL